MHFTHSLTWRREDGRGEGREKGSEAKVMMALMDSPHTPYTSQHTSGIVDIDS